MAITLAELKLQARQRADQEVIGFIEESELTSYINNSIAELKDLLAEAYGSDYDVEVTEALPITSGTESYDLPEDFYELKAVDIRIGSEPWVNVTRYNFNERNRFSEFNMWDLTGLTNIRYRLVGNKIYFTPVPDSDAEYRLWHVPVSTKLVDDADELDDLNAYSEYVIVDAAIKMMQKEESDVTVLMVQKQALEKRIRDKAQNRDAGQASTIQDIHAESTDYLWRRG